MSSAREGKILSQSVQKSLCALRQCKSREYLPGNARQHSPHVWVRVRCIRLLGGSACISSMERCVSLVSRTQITWSPSLVVADRGLMPAFLVPVLQNQSVGPAAGSKSLMESSSRIVFSVCEPSKIEFSSVEPCKSESFSSIELEV